MSRLILESGGSDGYSLESGTGVLLLETDSQNALFTNRRIARDVALLQAFQSDEGVEVDDFTTPATRVLWAQTAIFDPQIVKGDFQGTHGTARKREEGRYFGEQRPIAQIRAGATPFNLEWFLRSFAGGWTGSPTKTLAFPSALTEYVTLGLIEKVETPNPQKFLRFFDAWAHRVTLRLQPGSSVLEAIVDFAARDFDRKDLNALGPVVLPADLTQPNVKNFATHYAALFRDPGGANVFISIRELQIVFESGVIHEPWNDHAPRVIKEGFTRIGITLRSTWMDETYAIALDSEAQIPIFREFQISFTNGTSSLLIDLKNVDFRPSATGYQENGFREFIIDGEAYLDQSDADLLVQLTV